MRKLHRKSNGLENGRVLTSSCHPFILLNSLTALLYWIAIFSNVLGLSHDHRICYLLGAHCGAQHPCRS